MSFGAGGGSGEIKYVIAVDDTQAVGKLQSFSQQLTTVGQSSGTATQQIQQVAPALDQVATSTDKVEQSQRSAQSSSQGFGTSMASVGTSIAFAASSVISLVQQYTSLKRAENTLEKAQVTHKTLLFNITQQQDKYNKAVKEHGKHSKEAEKELKKLNIMKEKEKVMTEKLALQQESLSQRMMSFAVSVVPTVIGVVSGLAQTFSVLGSGRGGTGGMRGVLGLIGKFGPPLLILGGFLLAVKLNLFGIRDALDQFGNALGNTMPALKPVLNALRDLGVVIGLVPGNADEAQKRLKSFAGGVISWSKDVASSIGKIFDKLKSGDIQGAIKDIKAGLKTAFDITVGAITFDGKPIKKWVDQLITFWQTSARINGPWKATVDTSILIGKIAFEHLDLVGQAFLLNIKKNIESAIKNPAGGGLGGLVIDFDKWISVAKVRSNEPMSALESWLRTQVGVWKVQIKQKIIELKNWIIGGAGPWSNFLKNFFPTGDITGGLDLNTAISNLIDDFFKLETWNSVINTLSTNLFPKVGAMILNFLQDAFDTLTLGVTDIAATITKLLAPYFNLSEWGKAVNSFASTVMKIPTMISNLINGAFKTITTAALNIAPMINSIITPFFDLTAWATAINSFGSTVLKIPKMITDLISGAFDSIKTFDIGTIFTNILSSGGANIQSWFTDNLLKPLQSGINGFIDEINKFIDDIGTAFNTNLSELHIKHINIIPDAVTIDKNAVASAVVGGSEFGSESEAQEDMLRGVSVAMPVTVTPSSATVDTSKIQSLVQVNDIEGGGDIKKPGSFSTLLKIAMPIQVTPTTATVDLSSTTITFAQNTTVIAALFSAMSSSIIKSLNAFTATAQVDAGMITTAFDTTVNQSFNLFSTFQKALGKVFNNLAKAWSKTSQSFMKNMDSAVNDMFNQFSTFQKGMGKIFTNLGKAWSKTAQSFMKNMDSAVNDMFNSFSTMQKALGKIFKNLASAFSKMAQSWVANAKKAASGVQSAMNSVKNVERTITIRTVHTGGTSTSHGGGAAKGGLMNFAEGGIISAARGFTTNGPQMVMVGDNPGGHETVAFIPHNDPGPTLGMIARQFGQSGGAGHGKGNDIILNTVLHISGNDIINERALTKRVKMTVGENRDKFG